MTRPGLAERNFTMPTALIESPDALDLGALGAPVHVAVGTFDGVHAGHRALIGHLRDTAHAAGALAAVFTFQNHPREIVRPADVPPVLTTWGLKSRLLAATGIDILIGLPFTLEFSRTAPDAFVRDVLCRRCAAKRIVGGRNFHFGHRGQGNVETLRHLSAELGYEFAMEEPYLLGGEMVSSTRIRAALSEGRVEDATAMLGRMHEVTGTVVHGDHRGRSLGFPTANIEPDPRLCVPADGVYCVRATVGEERLPGVMNIGTRPTFAGTGRRFEVHLPGFSGDLYGRDLTVEFASRLRGELRFAGVDALRAQLVLDRDAALRAWERLR